MQQPLTDDYVGATQAAAILGVSRVTLHRWVKQGVLRAYTLGPRRVLIKRADLASLVRPIGDDTQAERFTPEPLTDAQAQQALTALEGARVFSARIAARVTHGAAQ